MSFLRNLTLRLVPLNNHFLHFLSNLMILNHGPNHLQFYHQKIHNYAPLFYIELLMLYCKNFI